MFLNDTSIITTQSQTFDPRLRPKLVFTGESVLTEYYVTGLENVPIHKIGPFVETQRKILEYYHGEVNVYIVTNDGYFGGLRYTAWETFLKNYLSHNR